MKMNENQVIAAFVEQLIASDYTTYTALDTIYLTNQILALVGEGQAVQIETETTLLGLKETLVQLAVSNQVIDTSASAADILGAQLMNFMTPLPSVVNQHFWQLAKINPEKALRYFYELSQANDYIKVAAIAKNIAFNVPTDYGELEITINLSKPEKDPKQIALAKQQKQTGYPKCQLCLTNEGYRGRANFPARTNHRVVRFNLGEQTWGFQYSPYAYFNEHCIFLDQQHEPMVINETTFSQLLQIVGQFPGYFAGSNADLPIVGGSILTHEHYQGGRHDFPMAKAPIETPLSFKGHETIQAGIVKWPMSVIRLTGSDAAEITALAGQILTAWQGYSDERVQVKAIDEQGVQHHTITPIARSVGADYQLDLVLRDNQTSAEFPDGIYHPHADVQHIKKENIGLIEVMGLAILPPRLKSEMTEVEKYLCQLPNDMADYHAAWAQQLREAHPEVTTANVEPIVQTALGKVFERVLLDAGVYKRDAVGQAAFQRFVAFVNQEG